MVREVLLMSKDQLSNPRLPENLADGLGILPSGASFHIEILRRLTFI